MRALLPWSLLLLCAPGCTPRSLPCCDELSEPGVQQRILIPPEIEQRLERLVAETPKSQEKRAVVEEDDGVFSMARALDFGLANNPRLRAAQAAILRAKGREEIEYAPFLPQVDMMNRYVGTTRNVGPGAPGILGVVLPTGDSDRQFGQTELQLHWTLCDFGRTCGRYGQAVSREKITELRLLRARQTVAFDVLVAYLQVLHARSVRRIQEQSLRNAEAFQDDAKARQRGGTAESNDVLRAGVLTAEAQEGGVSARQLELEALAGLNNAMGRNAGLPIRVEEWSAEPGFTLSLTESLETAAAQRQEIGMAREAVAAALQGRDAVKAEYLPRLFILSGAGEVGGTRIQNGGYVGAGIHLNQNLYSGGRRKGQLHEADGEVEEAIANAQAIFDGISLEVNLAYRKILAARERIDVTRTSVSQARENLRVLRSRYRNGNATPTDVIDAETLAVRVEQRFYLATYDYLQALGRLEYAMGIPQGALLTQPARETRTEEQLPKPRPVEGAKKP